MANKGDMNWYKKAQSAPLTTEEVRGHLRERGFDPERFNWDYDEESGTVYIRLFAPDGRLIGMQEYRPHVLTKGRKDKPGDQKRYFTEVPEKQNKLSRFWGAETIDTNKPYLFVTEGIFDAAPITMLGEPAIASIGSAITPELEQQMMFFKKKLIGILDNDETGNPQRETSKNRKFLKYVVERLGGVTFVVPEPYKDFGEMYQKSPQQARSFISSILSSI